MAEPYVLDVPAMTGDVAQTLRELVVLRLKVVQAGPRPNYSVHGESMQLGDLMRWFDDAINVCHAQLAAMQPCEIYSVMR